MSKKFLTNIDLNQLELQNAAVENLPNEPIEPAIGQIYFDTVLGYLRSWNGIAWLNASVGADGSDGVQGETGVQGLTGSIGETGADGGSNVVFKEMPSGIYTLIASDVGKILLSAPAATPTTQIQIPSNVFTPGQVINVLQRTLPQILIWASASTPSPVIVSATVSSWVLYPRAAGSMASIICVPSNVPGRDFFVVGDVV